VKTPLLRRIFTPFLIFLGAVAAAGAANPVMVPLGDNTFAITVEASSAFKRDTAVLKERAQDAAAKYCATQGKTLKVISLSAEKPWFSLGFPSARIVFKALNPGEVETVVPASATAGPTATMTPEARSLTTTEMYDDLVKLDDLHKKGILTDEEFQGEKRKILNRSH
jgi:hypothetical protein